MAFSCPTKDTTSKRTNLLCNLKTLMTDLEKELVPKVEPTCYTPICFNSCVPCCPPTQPEDEKAELETPDVMVCYKIDCGKIKKKKTEKNKGKKLSESKSRELRAGNLYFGCHCEKKNGLQDDCPRTGCHGSPECLAQPPTCGPSRFCGGKHLTLPRHFDTGEETTNDDDGSQMANISYKCYPAKIKTADEQICVLMPTCPSPCDPLCSAPA